MKDDELLEINEQDLYLDSQIFKDSNNQQKEHIITLNNENNKESSYKNQRNAMETKYKEQLGLSIINETLNENQNYYNSFDQSKNSGNGNNE